MTHYSRLTKIVIDVPSADHDSELAFWSAAIGQLLARFDRHPEYHGAALPGQEFWPLVQRLDDGPGRVQDCRAAAYGFASGLPWDWVGL